MNKADLIAAIAAESGLSKADSKKALDAFSATVARALKGGDRVALAGFGSFTVAERGAHEGINPSTLEKISIPAKRYVKFKASADLKL